MTEAQELIESAANVAAQAMVAAGDWLDGRGRHDAWLQARDARTNDLDAARRAAVSPNAVDGQHDATEHLSVEAVEVIHRIASDPGRLTRSWADQMIEALGEETYVELVGIAAMAAVVDTLDWSLTGQERAIGEPMSGDPAQVRPDDVGDVGAWVAQSVETTMANVSRSLSLVPVTNRAWGGLVQAMYSRGEGFMDLEWDRALSRPQVELVAARTTAELECFY